MKPKFKNMSFSDLLRLSKELAEIREEYSQKPSSERRMAASFQYDSIIASELFNDALSSIGADLEENEPDWPGEVTALAIDPEFALALLSVGGSAYLHGRVEECMEHFYSLASISQESESEIDKIIEDAADFLFDRDDQNKAIELVLLYSRKNPSKASCHDLLSYYYGKTNNFDQAVKHGRMAVKIESDNHELLSNLGWSLIESGAYDEAEKVINKALNIDPGYEYAKGNLKVLKERKSKEGI